MNGNYSRCILLLYKRVKLCMQHCRRLVTE